MKPHYLGVALAAILASAACNAEKGKDAAAATSSGSAKQVPPPKGGDWSTVVTQTAAGGYLMGNPNAGVKLVEYGSMTCPHCAEFDAKGLQPLIANYVKSGRVSFEFRNFVRDPFDLTASLIARCGGTKQFFPLTRQLFAGQDQWIGKIQSAGADQQQALAALPPAQQFGAIAKLAGLQQWAAQRGVPSAKSSACLANESEVNRLVQMNGDATQQYPAFRGTPSFVINGKLLDDTATWETLEPKLRAAVSERG